MQMTKEQYRRRCERISEELSAIQGSEFVPYHSDLNNLIEDMLDALYDEMEKNKEVC